MTHRNRQARYCSTRCRVAAHRAGLPGLLPDGRWLTWDEQKRPLQLDGRSASSTDPRTWTTHAAIRDQPRIGYVLGGGIGCIDLDHCLDEHGAPTAAAERFLANYPGHWIEISPSGDGLHIWGTLPSQPGRRRIIDELHVETYSRDRYMTVTGHTFQRGTLLPL